MEEFANGNTKEIVLPRNTVKFYEDLGENFDDRKNQTYETIEGGKILRLEVLKQTNNENIEEKAFQEKHGECLKTDKLMKGYVREKKC